ncbi:alpha-1,2-fucosyltransferase [Spongorhabdus nitratireducens]
MIIAKPVGGLANQMAVYAAAKALAMHHGVSLKLDVRHCIDGTIFEYRLNHLNLDVEFATEEEIKKTIKSTGVSCIDKLKKKIHKKTGFNIWGEYREKDLNFDDHFFDLPSNIYLVGNFPSILYYESVVSILREEFQVKSTGTEKTKEWEKKILGTPESVCIHVRRGDYKNKKTQAYHGLLGVEFFQSAINYMKDTLNDPEFFVFSDEIDWVKNNLITDFPMHYVDCHSGLEGHLDFRLMQKCRHFITSNSGFSRWPAFLSVHQGKVVCIPKNWFVESRINENEIAPVSWVRL